MGSTPASNHLRGGRPGVLSRNPLLQARLAPNHWPPHLAPALAWLGDSIQIKNPTSAAFQRKSGNNLLIVGQDPALAGGILASSVIGLAAHFAPEGPSSARFYILDGSPQNSPAAGLFHAIGKSLPHPLQIGGTGELSAILTELVGEIERRLDGTQPQMRICS